MAQGRIGGNSIYDFIYVDHPRIVYLSQFSPDGILKSLTRSSRTFDQSSAGLGIKGFIHAASEESAENALEREMDPQWALPLALLEELETKQLINREIALARLGEFVLAPGELSVVDLSSFKLMWDLPAFKTIVGSLISNATLAPELRNSLGKKFSLGEATRQILTVLPHTI
jgi:hypothetical protein